MFNLAISHFAHYSGWYFVDPNGGGISDSFEAECLFNGKRTETCIHPIQTGVRDFINESTLTLFQMIMLVMFYKAQDVNFTTVFVLLHYLFSCIQQ